MIGIYGGTFNPVHYGHLRTALEVREFFSLQELRFLPCAQPAHRSEPEVSADKRLDMLQLAIKNYPYFSCDTRELERPGVSYMIDSLISVRAEIGNEPLLLFVGQDAFNGLSGWHRWPELFDYAHIVVMTRPESRLETLIDFYRDKQVDDRRSLKVCPSGKIFFQSVTQLDISATFIRQIFADKKDSSFLLPVSVIEYIQENNLYQA